MLFGGSNTVTEDVAEVTIIKANIQKRNNNHTDKDDTTSSVTKLCIFGGVNAIIEAIVDAAGITTNMYMRNINNMVKDDTVSSFSNQFYLVLEMQL